MQHNKSKQSSAMFAQRSMPIIQNANMFQVWLLLLVIVTDLNHGRVQATLPSSRWKEPPGNGPGPVTFTAAEDEVQDPARLRRDAAAASPARHPVGTEDPSRIVSKITYLNDTHKQLMVHWVNKSQTIICLARDPKGSLPSVPSSVFFSYDYGETYENKTEMFKMDNGGYAQLEKFYTHSKYNTHILFNDIANKLLFVTTDMGRTITKYQLNFSPSTITFHEFQPNVFLIHDRTDPKTVLYMTEDSGQTWRMVQEYVKTYFWIADKASQQQLVIERALPSNLTTIFYTNKQHKLNIYALEVETVYEKENYIFTSMRNKKHSYDIFVSHKFGKKLKCIFDTNLDIAEYLVVDVSGSRALIAVRHTKTMSNLYVSENLGGVDDRVHFTLSLPNVFVHFPNSTWQNSWLYYVAEEAFADVYKVEGIAGIYIASQVLFYPPNGNIGPHHLASRITFDSGGSWRPISPPDTDMEGQPTSCSYRTNCSLHLSQKFMQLNPDVRSPTILSSKSAPGVIVATGVIGQSSKGHFGVYVSTDAGVTWQHSLRDFYMFNFGDHGGVLVAAQYLKMKGQTRHVLYSTDEGENWSESSFHDQEIRLYGLMTEPREKTPIFTMFGSLPSKHQWMIVRLDLSKVFKHNCTEEDYKYWSPVQRQENNKYVPCMLGQQNMYKRRIKHANCYNGIDFQQDIKMRQCYCDQTDFECDFGFVRVDESGKSQWRCVKNNSLTEDLYVVPSTCKPGETYNRTKGYRKIAGDVCIDEFADKFSHDVIPCPTTHTKNMLLFAKRDSIVQLDLASKLMYPLDIPNLKNVIAIDFDLSNQCVYWADIVTDTIARFCDRSGQPIEVLVASELVSVEGMALDWISKNLYFVDGMRAKIELIRTDINHSGRMRRTILDNHTLIKPRGVAVHPTAGYLFWTDWAKIEPSVKRANLDGSNVITIANKTYVEWPNGITVDYIAERVYWVDARNDYIGSADLNGGGFRKVNLDSKYVSHPFAVAVFKDDIYWDDWRMDSIFMANKDFGGNVGTLVANHTGLMDLKVVAHGTQQGSNKCSQTPSPCSSICVGSPTAPYYKCLCPDGLEMVNNACVCPGGHSPFANFSCPKTNGTCSKDHFTCANGICIPKLWHCDNEDNCGDNSDETNCTASTCPSPHFVCDSGKCIPHSWRCDYEIDCVDGTDELNCPRQNCSANSFHCDNGKCISKRWVCDDEDDCKDNSDERNCQRTVPVACKPDEFLCRSGNTKCISATWRCDGEFDCKDHSDEENCSNTTCTANQFACEGPGKVGQCIYMSYRCDGDYDCKNKADEKDCTEKDVIIRPPYKIQFEPENTTGMCQDWMFTCANRKCIPIWWKCDHADDCGDASDENGCNFISPPYANPIDSNWNITICNRNQFQCETGECISMAWVCDKSQDCANGEDEAHCEDVQTCDLQTHFKCQVDGNCIPKSDLCNGKVDCPDGSDEEFCVTNTLPGSASPSCSVGYFPCDFHRCFPLASLCDSKHDCDDGFDEGDKCKNITRVYQVLQMGVDERSINDTSFLLYWWSPLPDKLKLEYLPSISSVKDAHWRNTSWTSDINYRFDGLTPNTAYNMTVYVRVNGSDGSISPPAKYFVNSTAEGIPSEPYNLTAEQTRSGVLLQWHAPLRPNGLIEDYEITWYPPQPPIKLRLNDNTLSHELIADFEPGQKYSFYVTAFNRLHQSAKSEVKTVQIYDIDYVKRLQVTKKSNVSVTLQWEYAKAADGFMIICEARASYPRLPSYITNVTTFTLDNLPPDVWISFKVSAYKGLFLGPAMSTTVRTLGEALPTIPITGASLIKELGTSMKLTWNKPSDNRTDKWVYGIYYGITLASTLETAQMNTTELSATVHDLHACASYIFAVGVVAPFGIGQTTLHPPIRRTALNKRASPKQVNAIMDPSNHLQVILQWTPSCPQVSEQLDYTIEVLDKITNRTSFYTVTNTSGSELTKVFEADYGGVYAFRVRTAIKDSIFSPSVVYHAPPIMPPHELRVFQVVNGSYVVTWNERDIPLQDNFTYEVLVSEGNELDLKSALRFETKAPPFLFRNHSALMYAFGVRLKIKQYRSVLSETRSMRNIYQHLTEAQSSRSTWSIVIPVCLLLIALGAAFGFLIVKYRRLQNSFTRFANSHYNTRSEAATFDDNILDEDDTPQIRGFSDDEPLVVA